MLACEVIARYLRDAGVTHQFGLLGEGNIAVATALAELGVGFVPARREDAAVSMADGYARRCGEVGFVSVTHGPGMTNTVTALTEAVRHRSPVVLLTGVTPRAVLQNPQRFPTEALVATTGAGWREVRSLRTLADDVRAVFARAVDQRCPQVLGVPTELLYQVVDDLLFADVLPEVLPTDWRDRPRPSVVPDPAGVAAAGDLLAAARRPVVLVGRGVGSDEAMAVVDRLATRIGAPVATTLLGKGVAAGSSRHIGICGGFATAAGADLIQSSDLVVALGASLNPWTATELLDGARIVQVDVDPAALGRWRAVDVAVVGDAGETATLLLKDLDARGFSAPVQDRGAGVRLDPDAERPRSAPAPDGAPFEVGDVALKLRAAFPAGAVLCSDTGQATADVVSYVELGGPRRFVYPIHAGSIGLGLGSAIGAATACRDGEWVVHVTGDGSLMMALQELATVQQQQLRLAVVVLDDDGYGAEILYTEGRGLPSGLAAVPHPELGALARAFGLGFVEVTSLDQLDGLADLATAGGPPTLFRVPIRPGSASRFFRDYSTVTPVPSWSGGR
jgi:acetolactate synthase-1/2/3 large subunit